MSEIDKTIADRQPKYGEFSDRAAICEALIRLCSGSNDTVNGGHPVFVPQTQFAELSPVKKQAIRVICDKLSRILVPGGDPEYRDNWHDIQGYAKLAEDSCQDGDAKAQKELPLKPISLQEVLSRVVVKAGADHQIINAQANGNAILCERHGVRVSHNSDCPMCAVEQAKIAEHRKEQDMQKLEVAAQQKYRPIGGQTVPMPYCARHQNFYTYEKPCRQCDDLLKWGKKMADGVKVETPAELDPSDGA